MSPNGEPRPAEITSRLAVFVIGTVTSAAAIVLPRLLPTVFSPPGVPPMKIDWDPTWLIASAVLSAFVGGIVVCDYWQKGGRPHDIILTALGVPALLASMYNVHIDAKEQADQRAKFAETQTQLLRSEGIADKPAPPGPSSRLERPAAQSVVGLLSAFVAEPAFASTGNADPQFAYRDLEPKYWVVVGRDLTEQGAKKKMEGLNSRLLPAPPGDPSTKLDIVRLGDEFLIVDSGVQSRTDATLRAVSLKRRYSWPVELQQVPRGFK